ncbi:GIY-YIG nuclease family protein [Nostoc sp. CHAB 5784]|uniref:GIY-YIG nuclease family protein n=1 Tax=Nostoc mirabile TaxID=2907820 RepID=UPI001E4BE151|nr:GIY-YIG nuclease family protein [Nostoc mirabile]MCC5670285.1 GIY-YIG nuclease family protein [Nostoc mirabile CHAB5784]
MILLEETLQRYRSNQGYVYLIHAEGTNRYKIGRSVNPFARFEQLKVQSPYPLRIIDSFWTPDAINDEKLFHEQYKNYRIFGEWFELTDYSKEGWNSFVFDSEEEMVEKYSQSVDSVKDSFYFSRYEAQNISLNVAVIVAKHLISKTTFQSYLAFFPSNAEFSLELSLKLELQAVFYENLFKINTLKSLQYICDFGIKQWADCVMEALKRLLIHQKQIKLDEVELSIRGTITGFSACLSGGLLV